MAGIGKIVVSQAICIFSFTEFYVKNKIRMACETSKIGGGRGIERLVEEEGVA